MDSKFLGVGLFNALGIGLMAMLLSVFLKTLFNMYPVEGVSEVVNMA